MNQAFTESPRPAHLALASVGSFEASPAHTPPGYRGQPKSQFCSTDRSVELCPLPLISR